MDLRLQVTSTRLLLSFWEGWNLENLTVVPVFRPELHLSELYQRQTEDSEEDLQEGGVCHFLPDPVHCNVSLVG